MSTEGSTSLIPPPDSSPETTPRPGKKKPFYATLWAQVLIGVAVAVVFGYVSPAKAAEMKPLGDAFIQTRRTNQAGENDSSAEETGGGRARVQRVIFSYWTLLNPRRKRPIPTRYFVGVPDGI